MGVFVFCLYKIIQENNPICIKDHEHCVLTVCQVLNCVLITAYHRRNQACTLVTSAWWKHKHTPINNLCLRITVWAWTVCLYVHINICVLLCHFEVHCNPVWLLCDQCNKEGNNWLWSLFNISTTETWLGWQAPGHRTRSNVPFKRIRCLWETSDCEKFWETSLFQQTWVSHPILIMGIQCIRVTLSAAEIPWYLEFPGKNSILG